MAKAVYIGSNNSKKVKKMYLGNGTSHKVKKGYIGVGGVAKLFYSSGYIWKKYNTVETNTYYWNRYNVENVTEVKYHKMNQSDWRVYGSADISDNDIRFYYSSSIKLYLYMYSTGYDEVFPIPELGVINGTYDEVRAYYSEHPFASVYTHHSRYGWIVGDLQAVGTSTFEINAQSVRSEKVGSRGPTYGDYITDIWAEEGAYRGANEDGYYYITSNETRNTQKKGTLIDSVSTINQSGAYPQNGVSGGYWYTYNRVDTAYSQGSYIQDIEADNPSAYPSNGRHSDGYWYVKQPE